MFFRIVLNPFQVNVLSKLLLTYSPKQMLKVVHLSVFMIHFLERTGKIRDYNNA